MLLGEFTGSRIGAGIIGGIAALDLGAGIDYHQLAGGNDLVVEVIVQGLTMLGKDGWEGHAPALRQRDGLHLADNGLLDNAGNNAVAADSVHLLPEGTGDVELFHLAGLLDDTEIDHRLDECR